MKLLNHTSKYLAILLLPLIAVWAVIFYYAMLDEIYDGLDDGLDDQKTMLLETLATNPEILDQNNLVLWNHVITPISGQQYKNLKERHIDTLIYIANEKEFEPARIFESKITHEGQFYKVKFITSTIEEDDLIENLITYLIALYALLMIMIVILNNLVLKKIWQPFYNLISQLRYFRIENDEHIQTTSTSIEEFKLLNTSVTKLIQQSRARYLEQQYFIENASHELQTPLAISINKLELFIENTALDAEDARTMVSILDHLSRLTRLNKSLLLLSKIENQQFTEEQVIDFNLLLKHIIADFEDLAAHKNITFELQASGQLNFMMNKDLATILLTNLIKNAIVHGLQNNVITINLSHHNIKIQNYASPIALDRQVLFSRFKKISQDKKSTGLGLAIAKAISNKYAIELTYTFDVQHQFTVHFPEQSQSKKRSYSVE